MKIKIRKLRLPDVEILKKLFLNEKILKNTGVNVARNKITINFVREWLKRRIEQYSLEKPKFIVYAIIKNTNTPIGTIGIGNIDYKNKSAEIGYWISKEDSERGYCTDAIKIFIGRLPKLFNIKKIFAEVSKRNVASYKVLEKNGFEIIRKSNGSFILEKEVK